MKGTDSMNELSRSIEERHLPQVHAAALAGLAGMTPVRLAKLLDGFRPALAWEAVRAGIHPADPQHRFVRTSRRTDLGHVEERYQREGVKVLLPDMVEYPSMLVGDPGAPAVLFALGNPAVLEGAPRVAIVGTRSATPYGRQVASELARDLAAEGVVVVSGLAAGIDGAAHNGALAAGDNAAPPVAVVGTGLDVVYPPSNHELWGRVAGAGTVLSESALGTKPHPGVFPARNRIIAALSDVVVVVESHYKGGSLYTAEAAARRSIPVCAVPGSVRSRASNGTNALLVDGCTPIRDATDVLVALSLARAAKEEVPREPELGFLQLPQPEMVTPRNGVPKIGRLAPGVRNADEGAMHPRIPAARRECSMTESERTVVDAVDDVPTYLETILNRTDMSIAEVAKICDLMTEREVLIAGNGWWSRKSD
jgi:DNA processing protein